MARRISSSINDLPISESVRKFFWLLGRCPDDHAGLSELGFIPLPRPVVPIDIDRATQPIYRVNDGDILMRTLLAAFQRFGPERKTFLMNHVRGDIDVYKNIKTTKGD